MLLRSKLIVINISICNITSNVPDPVTDFPLLQAHKENVSDTNHIEPNQCLPMISSRGKTIST